MLAWVLNLGFAAGGSQAPTVVQAVKEGFYNGQYRCIGDVFTLLKASDLSSVYVSQVPVGDPDYPVWGWMKPLTPALLPLEYLQGLVSVERDYARRTVL